MVSTNNGEGMVMPVQPMGNYGIPYVGGYGNGGLNDSSSWLILFIILAMSGGWGNGFGGFNGGGFAADGAMLFPWMNQSNQINDGFRDQMINSNIQGIESAITGGFGDTALGIAGINQNICQTGNGIIGQMYNNTIADLERSYAAQTANSQGLNAIQAQVAGLGSDVAREACADRQAVSEALMGVTAQNNQNTNTIVNAINAVGQNIKDQMFSDKMDAKNDEIAQLRQEVLFARGQASQISQNEQIVNSIYNRLDTCPVGTTPVFGRTPIFTCNNNGGCGCGINY